MKRVWALKRTGYRSRAEILELRSTPGIEPLGSAVRGKGMERGDESCTKGTVLSTRCISMFYHNHKYFPKRVQTH